jgi:hypothetical protein
MKKSLFLLFVLTSFPEASSALPAKNFCSAQEQVILSCTLKKTEQTLSLCASKNLSANKGYLQYRFGKRSHIELAFPINRQGSQKAFTYARYTRPLVTYLQVRFVNLDYTYEIFSQSDATPGASFASTGIAVTPDSNKPIRNFECTQPISGSLSKLEGIVPQVDFFESNSSPK